MSLLNQLSFDKAYRANRMNAAQWVLKHPDTFSELMDIAFKNDPEISHKANWTLEFVCLENLSMLFPHLDYFFEHLSEVKEDSSVRPLAHICELLCISYYKEQNKRLEPLLSTSHKSVMTECCFDWLITEKKVACQVRAMLCLFYLGTENRWIHNELKAILQGNIPRGSAGYQARGKKILQMIRTFH
jgi:hypothetical protein